MTDELDHHDTTTVTAFVRAHLLRHWRWLAGAGVVGVLLAAGTLVLTERAARVTAVDELERARDELAEAYDSLGDALATKQPASPEVTAEALGSYQAALALRGKRSADTAASHERIGDLHLRRGETGAALAAYDESLAIRRALAERDETHQRALAIALNHAGRGLRRAGAFDEARRYFARSMDIRRQRRDASPDDFEARRDVTVQLIDDGELAGVSGDRRAALRACLDAHEIRVVLAEEDPSDDGRQRDLAVTQLLCARALLDLDRPAEARTYADALMVVSRQRAEAKPGDTQAVADLARAFEIDGRVRVALDDAYGALKSYRRFQTLAEKLTAVHPDELDFTRLLAASHARQGETYAARGELQEADVSYREALSLAIRVVSEDTENLDVQADVARIEAALGTLGLALDKRMQATAMLDQAKARYAILLQRQPQHAAIRRGVATTLHRLAQVMDRLGDRDSAMEACEQALAILAERPPGGSDELRAAIEWDLEGYRELP